MYRRHSNVLFRRFVSLFLWFLRWRFYWFATKQLGKDFIPPEEVAMAYGFSYDQKQYTSFRKTLPGPEIINWCREHGFMLVAGPSATLSLLDILELDPSQFFSSAKDGWYCLLQHLFSRLDKVQPQWLILRKTFVPGSLKRIWCEQEELISEREYIPNAAQCVWGIHLYLLVRGKRLFPRHFVRTSSVDSRGRRVTIGLNSEDGMVIDAWKKDFADNSIGIHSGLKYEPEKTSH